MGLQLSRIKWSKSVKDDGLRIYSESDNLSIPPDPHAFPLYEAFLESGCLFRTGARAGSKLKELDMCELCPCIMDTFNAVSTFKSSYSVKVASSQSPTGSSR